MARAAAEIAAAVAAPRTSNPRRVIGVASSTSCRLVMCVPPPCAPAVGRAWTRAWAGGGHGHTPRLAVEVAVADAARWCSLSRFAVVSGSVLLRLVVGLASLLVAGACARGPAPPDPAALGDARSRGAGAARRAHGGGSRGARLAPTGGARSAWPTRPTASRRRRARPTAPRRRSTNDHGRWWYRLALPAPSATATPTRRWPAFDRPSRCRPTYVPARWRRGLLLLDRGDLDGAEAAFRVAVEPRARRFGRRHRTGPRADGARPGATRPRPASRRCSNARPPIATPISCSAPRYRAARSRGRGRRGAGRRRRR